MIALVLAFAVAHADPALPPTPTTTTPTAEPALATTKAPAKIVRVAVMDLKLTDDIPPRTGRIVADNLVAEIRKLQGVTVVSMDELRSMLEVEASKQTLGCDEKESCLAEITEALGADVIVTGSVATLEGVRVFGMRRVSQEKAAVVAEVNERLAPANGEELLAEVGPAVLKLFPEMKLRAGEQRGVSPEKARLLNPPPLPAWSTLVVGGVGLVTAAAAVGVGFAAQNEADGLQAQIDASTAAPVEGKLLVSRQQSVGDLALRANVLYVGAGVLVLATTGMALFTDWTGARE